MALAESDVKIWWDIDEGSGTTLDNAEGTSTYDGTVTGLTWTTGGPSNISDVLDSDGGGRYISVGADLNAVVGTAADFSVSFWFQLDTTTSEGTLLSDWGGSGSRSVYLRVGSVANRIEFYVSHNGTTSQLQLSTAFSDTSSYHHLVVTRTGNDTEMYLDNASVDTNTGSFTLIDSNTNLLVGSRPSGNGDINGRIAQFCMFDKVISSSEVSDLYNSGNGITYASMFSGGGGGTAFSQGVVIA